MKDIKSLLHKIDVQEKNIEKIAVFLKTKRGRSFVSKLHTSSLKDLCERYQAPHYIRMFKNDTKNMNVIQHVIKKNNIKVVHTYTEPHKITIAKYPVYLTKKELKKINSRQPKKTLGFAEQLHMLEEERMNAFIANNPAPEYKEDLFPEELANAYNNMVDTARYKIRQQIVSARYKLSIVGRYKTSNGFVEKPLKSIRDIDGGGHHINDISDKHPLIRLAKKITAKTYKNDNSLVCTIIKGHGKQGRIIILYDNAY